MPTLSLRWIFALLGLFLVSVAADVYLSRSTSRAGASGGERVGVAVFLAVAHSGELASGLVVFRGNSPGLADLSATRIREGVTTPIRTTARLTDADLNLLRAQKFTEDDA